MKKTIVNKDAPVLRKVAMPVLIKDIKTRKIQNVLEKMKQALKSEDDGVAIAAPQVGASLRIFIESGKVLALSNKKNNTDSVENPKNTKVTAPDIIYINPEIIRLSKKKNKVEEGCLSVRWLYGFVERSEKATIRAYDEHGKKFEKGASGLQAQIFQHEVDHLNGILFIDKAENLENLPPSKKKK